MYKGTSTEHHLAGRIQKLKHMKNHTSTDSECDLVISNVTVWVGSQPQPQSGWLAIHNGVIHSVGKIGDKLPRARQLLDGLKKTILPSFVDCHTHISAGSIASICRNGAHLTSKHDALEEIASAAKTDPSDWLVMFYVDWNAWNNPRPPTAQELEDASKGRKVILVCESLHRAVLSESGLKACNVSQHADSRFVESRKGVLNGTVWEEVFSDCLGQVLKSVISSWGDDEFAEVLNAEANRHLAVGITDAHDPCVTAEMSAAMQRLNATTPLRISWSQAGNMGPVSTATGEETLDSFGDGPSSAKVFTDGAHRCAMCIEAKQAARMTIGMFADAVTSFDFSGLRQVFNDPTVYKQGHFYNRVALFEPDDLTKKLTSLDQTHERIKIHALGNHAVNMTCDCILESGITTKVCVEHATILDDHSIENMAKLGVQVSAQPGFLPHFAAQFSRMKMTGKYRGLPFRSMLDAGVDLIMSSDYPCGPLDPLHNIRCAVNRLLSNGKHYLEQEAVSPQEAIYAYTIAGPKGITGTPKQGIVESAAADFVMLTGDPFVESTKVDSTWIGGEIVYQASPQCCEN